MGTRIRTYSEVCRIDGFLQRFKYLALRGNVGHETFGHNRWMNQRFYASRAWKSVRRDVIIRDCGMDLAVDGHDIHDELLIHHINPITEDDLARGSYMALDPDNLICTQHSTHNAIHYGDESLLPVTYVPRRPGDTKLW